MNHIAHITEDGTEQRLIDHLTNAAELARKFSESFGAGDYGYKIGLYHDIGKYSDAFQRRMRGATIQVDHATAGGQLIHTTDKNSLGLLGAYCITGHHGGLPNGGSDSDIDDASSLNGRLRKDIDDYSGYETEVPDIPALSPPDVALTDGFSVSCFTRMMFSALVDADWLDTEDFMHKGAVKRGEFASINELNDKIQEYIKPYFHPNSELNAKRTELLNDCISAAEFDGGLFTLTAPTGSGKTVSSAAFALAHAVKHHKKRVIYVVPYNTIIEQNAKVFEDILGVDNVLQHHCNIEYNNDENTPEYKKLLATENWDAPFIVTSSVQFFESLFGNKSSSCRKLHNIANSVIVFDEAQMIPIPYLLPCVSIIRELVTNYRCTAVLATATQSSLDPYFQPRQGDRFKALPLREIVSEPSGMYEFFRRVNFKVIEELLSDDALAKRLNSHKQVLCVVNTRKRAQSVVGKLHGAVFHLSTTMVPQHRTAVLNIIRKRLKDGEECRVVSTSLVEAGVDVDFPALYREKSGLDSIIQAAGRCNREGKNPRGESVVYIFTSEDGSPKSMAINVAAYADTQRRYEDIASLEAIKHYFEQLRYIKGEGALDEKGIIEAFNSGVGSCSFPFARIAKEFRLIEQNTKVVFVTYDDDAECLAERLRRGERSRKLFKAIQKYSVSLYVRDIEKLRELGAIEQLPDENEVYILSGTGPYYSELYGVTLEPSGGHALFGE
jgi:CRISPR-associated endonuclease/helicase Cas3